jgi:hypothetical protein
MELVDFARHVVGCFATRDTKDRYCSPRHGMLCNSRHEGSNVRVDDLTSNIRQALRDGAVGAGAGVPPVV